MYEIKRLCLFSGQRFFPRRPRFLVCHRNPVLAEVDATSTETVAVSAEPVDADESPADTLAGAETDATEELPSDDQGLVATEAATTSSDDDSELPVAVPPEGLTEVHIIGTKYVDYFTDGTTITLYPGDPEIPHRFVRVEWLPFLRQP